MMDTAIRLLALVAALALLGCSEEAGSTDQGQPPDAPGKTDEGPAPDAQSPLPAGLVILDHVTVVDADGARPGRAVLLLGETVFDVRPAGQSWPADATVVDGSGRFVVPGLVDAHVHLTYGGSTVWVGDALEANLRASLYHGVTAVMDVGAGSSIYALRRAITQGRVIGPRLRATGPFITAPGSHPCESSPFNDCLFITDVSKAAKQAQALVQQGADAFKVALADTSATPWPAPRLDPAVLGPIAKLGLPVVAHVNSSKDVVDAVAQGVTILAHPVFVETISQAALQQAASVSGVHTTLGAFAAGPDLVDGKLDLTDTGLIVGPGVKANWQVVKDNPSVLAPGWLTESRAWAKHAADSVQALRGAGATLVPGSDAGYLFVPHGLGLQLELRRLATLGWTPQQLLTAATLTARKLVGLPGGRVAAGQPADLLLLSQDPLGSVEALDAIEQVVLRGKLHPRESLRTLQLQLQPGGQGETCLGPQHCAAGLACDRLAHLCRPACPTPYAPVNPCGPGAWCMPLDAQPATKQGVCRPEPACDLYQQDCGPAFYKLSCFPLDADTNGCMLSGTQGEGQSCSTSGPLTTCKPGLYCSPLDSTCYRLCDPAAPAGACTAPTSCVQQSAATGVAWFGLCL